MFWDLKNKKQKKYLVSLNKNTNFHTLLKLQSVWKHAQNIPSSISYDFCSKIYLFKIIITKFQTLEFKE